MHTISDWRSPCASSQSGPMSSCRPSGHSSRGSAAHQGGPGVSSNCVPASARLACCSCRVASHAIPLSRSSRASGPARGRTHSAAWRRAGWKGRLARKMKDEMPYSTVSGVCSCSRASTSHCGCSPAFRRSNRAFPSSVAGGSLLCSVRTSSAVGLTLRRKVSIAPSCASLTRSHLLMRRRSANSSWSQSRCATVRWSPSVACHPRSTSVSIVSSCSKTDAASTTVTRLCRLATSPKLTPLASSVKVKVSATGSGSEMPDDSTRTWSKRPSAASEASEVSRSSRSVQQMQPLESSTIFSSCCTNPPPCRTSSASTLTLDMSFTTTAMRTPSRLFSMWFKSVVFPAPRNPERIVTGRGPAPLPWLRSSRFASLTAVYGLGPAFFISG
mmetsp:Transcript_16709/g.54212  ORF Transcript_16709/g.54212 Transcript_16709/m.54212 type:complete len:386 (-) Transcript_16709:440-1597(-)